MKCEEALTKIEAYINHTLNGRELEEFLEHVTSLSLIHISEPTRPY